MRRQPLALPLTLVLLAASLAAQQTVYVAPTPANILLTAESHSGRRIEREHFVSNQSTVPIIVLTVTLSECQNVEDRCGEHKVNKKVAPGRRVMVMRVRSGPLNMGFTYRSRVLWRPDSTASDAIAAALGRNPDARDVQTTLKYRDLYGDRYAEVGPRIAALRLEPDSLVLEPGQPFRMNDLALLALDSAGEVLGRVRDVMWSIKPGSLLQAMSRDQVLATQPGRTRMKLRISEQAQAKVGRPIPELVLPVVAAFHVESDAPVFSGIARDADSRRTLACARVALEDTVGRVVAIGRTQADGMFALQAPRSGAYRVRIDTYGWVPARGPLTPATAGEEKQGDYAVRFVERIVSDRNIPDFQHARPVSIRTATVGRPTAADQQIGGVALSGSASYPVLGVNGPAAMTTWIQFTVDEAGSVDTTSVTIPADVAPRPRATIAAVMRRLRFEPARENEEPACELIRMQVDVSAR